MATPGFTAEASVYRSITHYSTLFRLGSDSPSPISPAAPNGGRGGLPCPNGWGCCGGFTNQGFCKVDCCPKDCCGNQCCLGTEVCCSDGCADLRSNTKNCGKCGTTCPNGLCINGTCVACPSGLIACGASAVHKASAVRTTYVAPRARRAAPVLVVPANAVSQAKSAVTAPV